MKALTTLVGSAACVLLAAGCEISVGHLDGDSSFWDDERDSGAVTHPSASAKPSAASSADQEPDDAATDSQPNVEPESDADVPEDAAAEDAASTPSATPTASASPSPSASATPPPSSYLCVAPVASDACDVCVEKNCKLERTNCCGEDCEDIWPEVQQCMIMITDAGDPEKAQLDLDSCLAGSSPDGTDSHAFDMDEQFQLLLSCVNTTYTGEPDNSHLAGDGTCTIECYGVATLMTD